MCVSKMSFYSVVAHGSLPAPQGAAAGGTRGFPGQSCCPAVGGQVGGGRAGLETPELCLRQTRRAPHRRSRLEDGPVLRHLKGQRPQDGRIRAVPGEPVGSGGPGGARPGGGGPDRGPSPGWRPEVGTARVAGSRGQRTHRHTGPDPSQGGPGDICGSQGAGSLRSWVPTRKQAPCPGHPHPCGLGSPQPSPAAPARAHGPHTRTAVPASQAGAGATPSAPLQRGARTRPAPLRRRGQAVVLEPEVGRSPAWWGACAQPHSSLCSGRHWGTSFSSSTPSGAHTQGSCVSHCHLASWLRSASSTGA